jgi:hypothetical protein
MPLPLVFPDFAAHAKDPSLKALFGRLATLEQEARALDDRRLVLLERARTRPMSKGERQTLAEFQRDGLEASREQAMLMAALPDDALYRIALSALKTQVSFQFKHRSNAEINALTDQIAALNQKSLDLLLAHPAPAQTNTPA